MSRPIDSETGAQVGPLNRGAAGCIADPGAPPADLDSAILREFRSLKLPGLRVRTDPEGWTLVNLATRFRVVPSWTEKNLGPILGRPVTVKITPMAYRWSFGDGSRQELSDSQEDPERTAWHTYGEPGVVRPSRPSTARRIGSTVGGRGPSPPR